MSNQVPEPPFRAELRRLSSEVERVRKVLTTLTLHGAGGQHASTPALAAWQPVAGRPGVECYHVPHPDGLEGLFVGVFRVAPQAHFEGSTMDESRLVVTLAGEILLNDVPAPPGVARYLAPGEPVSWQAGAAGSVSVTIYDVPPHDVDPALLPPS